MSSEIRRLKKGQQQNVKPSYGWHSKLFSQKHSNLSSLVLSIVVDKDLKSAKKSVRTVHQCKAGLKHFPTWLTDFNSFISL